VTDPPQIAGQRATRVLRIAAMAVVVAGAEWRLADPHKIAATPELRGLPWALLAILFPLALGAWAFSVTGTGKPTFKEDLMWAVLAGTLVYLALFLLA
jgi:hypothetical protein